MPKTLKQHAIDIANSFTRWQLWQGGGSTTLSDLTDVELSDLQSDDVLKYDGNKWINAIIQGGGSVGAKVDLLGTLYAGTNQPLSTITQYDLIIFLVRDNSEPWKYRGSATFTKNEIKINNQLIIPSDESERTILTISDWSIIGRYNLVVYGIKFAQIEPNLHEYSTEEKVIGKWIDGKPIYEKTAHNLSVNIGNFWTSDNSLTMFSDIETIVNCIIYTGDRLYTPKYVSKHANNTLALFGFDNFTVTHVILQYTKTTD